VAQALLCGPSDPEAFRRSLAWTFRFWLLGLPAGVGSATARSILKLWVGFPPSRSGVYSAGNGPAMRAAILGVCFGDQPDKLVEYVQASTRITHSDPRAARGALLVAIAAHFGASHSVDQISSQSFQQAIDICLKDSDPELQELLSKLIAHLEDGKTLLEFARTVGVKKGVTGYVYRTVPIALYCWLRHTSDFRQAVEQVISLGGDTDTTGAIVGAIMGATHGESHIPKEWLDGLIEWPRSPAWMRRLSDRLGKTLDKGADSQPTRALPLFWPGLILRNVIFLILVLAHGFRRLLPPY
jgi:ADP-ribosyl-[dinitrogen reductase] hydrolase